MIAADQISYEDLYARWEQGNWSATGIDFSVDRRQWQGEFSELERRAALWTYAMFLHGEDVVADTLSPYIDAAPLEAQKYFLATQQADEARHAVMFSRFMREVAHVGSDAPSTLAASGGTLTWGFRKVFGRLEKMASELRRERSKPKLAQAITLYHLVIEASIAQPGQHFIEASLSRRNQLPGLLEGVRNVSRDEQRHIAFGVKMIADLVREDPDCEPAIAELLREILPYMSALFVPPGWDERYVTLFGFTLEDVYAHGAEALEGRLRAAGLRPEAMRIGMPFDQPPRERARRALALLRAGYLGEPGSFAGPDPKATALLFDSLRRQVDTARRATIQWEFTDAEPWYLRIDNGATAAAPGRAQHPDLTFRCRLADWVDITAGRTTPLEALARGRLRPRGNPRMLLRARALLS